MNQHGEQLKGPALQAYNMQLALQAALRASKPAKNGSQTITLQVGDWLLIDALLRGLTGASDLFVVVNHACAVPVDFGRGDVLDGHYVVGAEALALPGLRAACRAWAGVQAENSAHDLDSLRIYRLLEVARGITAPLVAAAQLELEADDG